MWDGGIHHHNNTMFAGLKQSPLACSKKETPQWRLFFDN
jgi:hypothetical protein